METVKKVNTNRFAKFSRNIEVCPGNALPLLKVLSKITWATVSRTEASRGKRSKF
jgi:hypothetical protein